MELFFPVSVTERDALLRQRFEGPWLAGMADRIDYDAGVDEDAIWVVTDVGAADVGQFREADSHLLGYESYVLPMETLNQLSWREVPPDEVARLVDIANPS